MRHYVLVAGVDYERKGVDFRLFCNNRLKRLVAANKAKEELAFTIFDFKAGAVVTHEVTYPAGRRAERTSTDKRFDPVTRAHYDRTGTGSDTRYVFKDGQFGVMSVLDVYSQVQAVGRDAPGTLRELSFFSHAWHGGPILVNSFDDGVLHVPNPFAGGPPVPMPLGSARDPDDMDPRTKDFRAPTMGAPDLARFRSAYHVDGHSWNWGCAFPRVIHEILHKLEHHPKYRSSGLGDAVTLSFTNFRTHHVDQLRARLGAAAIPDPKKVELEFGQLKRFFCSATQDSYTHHLAVASDRKAYGGVIGTYSEYDTGVSLALMNVHKGFARHLTFYKNYLGFAFDPEGRRYGEFKPTFSC